MTAQQQQTRRRPGEVRDAIRSFLSEQSKPVSVNDIYVALDEAFGEPVARSSVRSSLNLGVDDLWRRTGRGQYRIIRR